MRYKVVGDYNLTSNPREYEGKIVYARNLELSEAIDYIRSRVLVDKVVINKVYTTKKDHMDCFNYFEIKDDRSVESIFISLSMEERRTLFAYAYNHMDERVDNELLQRKIQGFE